MNKAALVVGGLGAAAVVLGQLKAEGGGLCSGPAAPATGRDLVCCEIGGADGSDFLEYGTAGNNVSGYAFGTTVCNNGTTVLYFIDEGPDAAHHPVIGQNLFRLMDGRFEQVGLSWLKHAFCAADGATCGGCAPDVPCETLQVGCSDIYGSAANGGLPSILGPRAEVNPVTGVFPFPHATPTGANPGRLLVHYDDLDPALNPGAIYFGEGVLLSLDDAGTANSYNNTTWREVSVGPPGGSILDLSFTGASIQQEPAINAWQDLDPDVTLVEIAVPGDGRFVLGHTVTSNGDGTWHYEYALYNQTSHRAARVFTVPTGGALTVTNIGFHDVRYRNGDGVGGNFDNTDWAVATAGGAVSWSTDTEAANPNANALRWSTLYNFRFDANAAPVAATATVGLYRAGAPAEVSVPISAPDPCPWDLDGDGVGVTDLLALLGLWGADPGGPPDFDDDGVVGVTDLLALLAHWGECVPKFFWGEEYPTASF